MTCLGVNQYRWSKLWAWNPKNRLNYRLYFMAQTFFSPRSNYLNLFSESVVRSFRSTQLTSAEAANYQLPYFITHARLHSPTFFFCTFWCSCMRRFISIRAAHRLRRIQSLHLDTRAASDALCLSNHTSNNNKNASAHARRMHPPRKTKTHGRHAYAHEFKNDK